MSNEKTTHSSHFDYENVIARMKKTNEKRHWKTTDKAKEKPTRLRSRYGELSNGGLQERRVPLWSRLGGALRDESKQLVAAGLVMAGFVAWLGSTAQAYYTQHAESVLAEKCEQNALSHAASTVCFDNRRIVHVLKPDGTTTKPGLDWRVNEAALRKAEMAAAREARGGQANEQ